MEVAMSLLGAVAMFIGAALFAAVFILCVLIAVVMILHAAKSIFSSGDEGREEK